MTMTAGMQLFIHNIAIILSATVTVALVVFVIKSNHRKVANIALASMLVSVLVYYIAHLIGTNVTDPYLSRAVLMANVSVALLSMFMNHAVLAILGKDVARKGIIMFVYAITIALVAFYLVFPDSFLLPSVPKMYFPNYYVPGEYHWVMRLLSNNLIPLYFFSEMVASYIRSKDAIFRNRLKYLFVGSILGYVTGFIPVLLVYDIPVNPLWGAFFVFLFGIPFTYGAVKYELLDIKIVAKRAFGYALAIAVLGGGIVGLNSTSNWIERAYPTFPFWFIPFVSAIFVVAVSVIVWKKLRETDILKYEFITTATHKFRTPLTHIRWATENLKASASNDERVQLEYIESANTKLVELTNVLMNVSEAEGESYEYHMQKADLSSMTEEVIASLSEQMSIKRIVMVKQLEPSAMVECDADRIRFIVQTFIENAVHYTPENGTVTIAITRRGGDVVYSVRDTGIGMSKEDIGMLFSKFYRGRQARLADTEGMGIGLYVSKEIIGRHHGKIWAESEGSDRGSTFYFSLPAAK